MFFKGERLTLGLKTTRVLPTVSNVEYRIMKILVLLLKLKKRKMRGDHRDGAAEKRAGGRKSIVVDEVENSVHVCEVECGGCGYGKDLHALDGQWWLW